MLLDQFDASLVVLRRRFCWSYTDIFYKRYTTSKNKTANISEENIAKILSPKFNMGEKLFYDSFKERWWKQKELTENDFWDEVNYFFKQRLFQ